MGFFVVYSIVYGGNFMSKMPVLFVGHGSPMNAIEKNPFSAVWEKLGSSLPRPEAVLSVSAHWYTQGTRIMDSADPKQIYDMYGFPDELYRTLYPVSGSPFFAGEARKLLGSEVITDNSWGIDHGSWSVLRRMYPAADIPVFQLSVDRTAPAEAFYAMGQKLRPLRDRGVLIFCSGNVVHNLSLINWNMSHGYPWADEFDEYIKKAVLKKDSDSVIHYRNAGSCAEHSFLQTDHFAPLLFALGAADPEDQVSVFNEARVLGSLSMTGYLFQN